MTYMHTADLVLRKWNKKPCTSTTEKKDKQTRATEWGKEEGGVGGGRVREKNSSYIFWINS